MKMFRSCKNFIDLRVLFIIFFIIMLFRFNKTEALEYNKFYTLSPSTNSSELWSIDPATAATSRVTTLSLPDGSKPNFASNALAFSPDNELFSWDTNKKQLYKIDYKTGQINYIGSPNANSSVGSINGLAFNKEGTLYGLAGESSNAKLYAINTITGELTSAGNSYAKTSNNGLATNFQTNELYAVSGLANDPNYLLKINPNTPLLLRDDFTTNTTGNYSWTGGAGTGYSWNQTGGYVTIDADNGEWKVAALDAFRNVDSPANGYAKIGFNVTKNVGGQSRLFFTLAQDANNFYQFSVTDNIYGSSGWTQGIKKKVNGVEEFIALPGSLNSTGNYTWEMWWNPTNLRMDLNGVTIQNIATTNDAIIDPMSMDFRVARLIGNWDYTEIDPGVAQIVGNLGINYSGVGTEFDPVTGLLYTIRNQNSLYTVDTNTGLATSVGTLDNGLTTVNLAHLWPGYVETQDQPPVVPEPGTLFLIGSMMSGIFIFKKIIKK